MFFRKTGFAFLKTAILVVVEPGLIASINIFSIRISFVLKAAYNIIQKVTSILLVYYAPKPLNKYCTI
jgi:hypothetical protein